MKSSTKNVVRKRAGRPATGQDPVTAIRLSAKMRDNVDAWASKQEGSPTRSEAIRRLVELGLTVKTKAKPAGQPSAAVVADLAVEAIDSLGSQIKGTVSRKASRKLRAQDLATKAIEKIIDPAAPPEERAQRRRRLTKGPSEFRNARVDQPMAKRK